MSDQIVDEKVFPRRPRQALNELWRLARCLREVKGTDPLTLTRSDSNLVVAMSPEVLELIRFLQANRERLGNLFDSTVEGDPPDPGSPLTDDYFELQNVEIYLADSDTVEAFDILAKEHAP
jgi:hypothetical protein